ncbi:MAG: Multi-sensor signal transduction histidine kinase, partial [Pedosphaera sp.]|nr:Multi-sensor signal transduction histidine kinase [Pedosphaera sp.]
MNKTLRVLLLEDSEADALFVLRQLQRGGYEPAHQRVDTEAGFNAALKSQEWDLVIADYSLPQFTATEALSLLQGSGIDLPFIIVSGAIGEEVAVAAMRSGAHDYILKNSLARLVPAVERELREARARRERQRAEEGYLRLAAIVESSGDAIIGKALDGMITSWNQGAERLFGYTAEQVKSHSTLILLPPERLEEETTLLERLKRGERIEHFETVRVRMDGRRIDVSLSISPIKDAQGRIVGASKIARDITERKRAETCIAALSKLGQNLSSASTPREAAYIIGNIADDLFGWDAFTLDLYFAADDSIRTVLNVDSIGNQRQEVPSTYLGTNPSPIARQVIEQGAELILREETGDTRPGLIAFGDASRRSASLMFVPVRNQTRVIGILSVQSYTLKAYERRDLSTLQTLADYCGGALERIRVREELRESQERFRRVVESDMMGILFWNRAGGISDANDKLLSMVGYTREDLEAGRVNWAAMTPPEYGHLYEQGLAEVAATGTCAPFEKEFIRKDGSRVSILVGAASLKGAKDQGVCFVLDITERKQAVEGLRKSEERYRKLSESAPIGIFETEAQGLWTYTNLRWTVISGLSSEESLGFGWVRAIHPEDRAEVEEHWRRAVAEGQEWAHEHRLQTPQGIVRWVRMQAASVMSQDSQHGGYVGTVEDITKSKKAADALRAAQDRLQHLVSSSPAVLYALRVNNDTLLPSWVSENIAQMTGYGPEETLSSQWWAEHLHLTQGPHLLIENFERNKLLEEYPLRRKDGTEVWIRDEKRLLRNAAGELVEVVGSWSDITERKLAEEAQRRLEAERGELLQRLQSVFNLMPIGCILHDAEFRFTYWNPAAEDIFGYSFQEVEGRHPFGLITPAAAQPQLKALFNRATAGDSQVNGSFENSTKDGRTIICEWKNTPLRKPDGSFLGLISMCQDITDRKLAEEELSHSRGQLRALAAHLQSVREEERKRITREIHDELGQSLTGFKMDLAWMRNRLRGEDVAIVREPLLEKISTMGALLDGMATLMRRLCTELRPGVLDDLGLIAAIEWQTREYQHRTGIECEVKLELGDLNVDPERSTALFRILQEILTNVARHASASRVVVILKRAGKHLLLEVKDNGRGITEQEKSGSKSLGLLGLRERAVILGGEVQIEGRAGKGTTVRVSMPLPQLSPEAEHTRNGSVKAGHPDSARVKTS